MSGRLAMKNFDLDDLHWMMDMLHSIDVGIMVLDQNYRICTWNGFMANHSGKAPEHVVGQNLFEIFPEIPQNWFKRKIESVLLLKTNAFTIWEQRPYLIRFKNYRPITGPADFMYQNITLIPLLATDGNTSHVGVIIYDVTDVAVGKTELTASNQQLADLSRTDQLSQLNNRGYWEAAVAREFERYQRTRHECSLVMFDIDYFKRINDSHGHQAGDVVIREMSKLLRHTARGTDICGRYGGEEFGVLLVGADAKQAMIFAERLRQQVEALIITYDNHDIRFTISLGVSELNEHIPTHIAWISSADQALYHSKHLGRNRATIS